MKEFPIIEKELNDIYQQIKTQKRFTPDFLKKLKLAEQAWIKYRAADLEALYPAEDKMEYGSVYQRCYPLEMNYLAEIRIEQLKKILNFKGKLDSKALTVDKAKLELKKIDDQLNTIYKNVMQIYKSDTLFIKKMKAAELAWIEFRDRHVEAMVALVGGDSKMAESMAINEKIILTQDRVYNLERWIEGTEEGDVCRGSIRVVE